MPYSKALLTIFSAIFNLSSAFLGIPLSSKVSPTTAAPYFFINGNKLSNTLSSPFTELTIAFPLYTLNAFSITLGLLESI